jgi:hypothetical protein
MDHRTPPSDSRRTGALDTSPVHIETELVDLTAISLSQLQACEESVLEPSLRRMLAQIDRPRTNLGGSGPPGRAD